MAIYLHPITENGAYSQQSTPFENAIIMNDDQLPIFLEFKGFGTVSDGIFTGNQSALDTWNSNHPNSSIKPMETYDDKIANLQTQLEATQEMIDGLS